MNRADLLYEALKDGQPHSRRDIQERVGYFLTNNAASELRARGYDVQHFKDGRVDTYQLGSLNPRDGRVDAAVPRVERADSGGELRLSVRSTTSAPSGGHSPSATPSRAVDDAGLAHGPGVLGAEVPGQLTIEVAA